MIKRRIAAAAYVGAGCLIVIVLAGKGHLGAFANDDALLFGRQFVVGHSRFVLVNEGYKIMPCRSAVISGPYQPFYKSQ